MRLARLLLRLYPRSHREAYGAEMLEAARVRIRHASGSRERVVTRLALWTDLVAGAAGVHLDRWNRSTGTMGTGSGWGLDMKYVLRSLWRSPAYVSTTVVVLACAVAATTAVFSYARGTLLSQPPWPEPGEVVIVWGSNVANGQLRDVVSGPDFIDLEREARAFDHLAAFHTDADYLMVDGRPTVIDVQEVSAAFFDVLGVEAFLGRLFDDRERDSGAGASVVVTYGFWRDHLDADPGAIGTVFPFVDRPGTIVGVLSEGFEFVSPTPIFVPLGDDELAAASRSSIHYNVLGRLASGVTLPEANLDAGRAMDRIVTAYPDREGWSFLVEPLTEVSVEAVRPVLVVLSVTVGLILLVALVNLATLFRIRAFARSAESAVRSALGAGRSRLARVLVLETLLLATTGALLGLAVTPWLLARVGEMVPLWIAIPDSAARVPVLRSVLDPWVASVSVAGAVAGALLLTIPSFRAATGARGGPATRRTVVPGMRGTRLLVGVELALATVLCLGAGLVGRSTIRLLSTEVGVEAEGVLTLYFGDVWTRPAEAQVAYFREVVEEVERIPGVTRAGVTDYVDFMAEDDFAGITFLDRDLQPVRRLREEWRRVDHGFFEASGMTMARGRAFEADDFVGGPRVAIVNEAFARKHYRDGDAIGGRLSTHAAAYEAIEIVGVVEDVRSLGPASAPPPMLYAPNQGAPRGTQGLYVRAEGDALGYANAVREAIWSVDPSQPVVDIVPLAERVDDWIAIPRTTLALVGTLASLAWLLSVVGVFGVVAYAVRTRRAELGIRLALGATPARLEKDQLRAIVPVVVLGVGIGVILGTAAARAARPLLHDVGWLDPFALLGAVVAMGAAAVTATWIPARRAGRVDPREVIATE